MSRGSVGVAMSLYNQGRYVAESIESLLDQTAPPDQIVVVDDGSTDDGPEIVQGFESHGVLLLQTHRQGVSNVLNAAVTGLTTDLVAIQACDDRSEPERLEWQTEVMNSRKPAAVFSLPNVIDEFSDPMPDSFAHEFFVDANNTGNVLKRLFETGNFLCASSAFMRRDSFFSARAFHPGLLHLQDFLLWIRLAHQGNFEVIDERLVGYRRNSAGGNLSSPDNDSRMRAEMQYVYQHFFDGCSNSAIQYSFDLEAVSDESRNGQIAELLLTHHDLIARQAGVLFALEHLEFDMASTTEKIFEPQSLFAATATSDVDRQQSVEAIYQRLRHRAPWDLSND